MIRHIFSLLYGWWRFAVTSLKTNGAKIASTASIFDNAESSLRSLWLDPDPGTEPQPVDEPQPQAPDEGES